MKPHVSAMQPPPVTTAQRDAISAGRRGPGSEVFNTDTGFVEYNAGSDAVPVWIALTNAVPKSLVTAKGDLLVGTAAGVVARKAVGVDRRRLAADSTQTDGLAWIAGGWTLVDDWIAPGGTIYDTNATIGSIPTTFKSLHGEIQGKSVTGAGGYNCEFYINHDTGLSYDWQHIWQSSGGAAGASGANGVGLIQACPPGALPGTGGRNFHLLFDIYNYQDATNWDSHVEFLGSSYTTGFISWKGAGRWGVNNNVARLEIAPNGGATWAVNTRITLWGRE